MWLNLFFLNALPAALVKVYRWIHDWQILIVGILILIAGQIWVNKLVTRLTRSAEMTSQSHRAFAEFLLTTMKRENPALSQNPAETTGRVPVVRETPNVQFSQSGDISARLDRLRDFVRSALSIIPVSDVALAGQGAKLYQRLTSFSFEDLCSASRDNPEFWRLANDLENELSALKMQALDHVNCHHAWETLVRINTLARQVREKMPTPAVLRSDVGSLPPTETLVTRA